MVRASLRWRRPAMAGLIVWAGLACARTGAIPGGPEDRVPPLVIATEPAPDSIVESWEDPVRIKFSERISERTQGGSLDAAVIVSPQLDDVRVGHSRDALQISVPGGFPEGQVYRITVLPQIVDMFGNRLPEPFEFVFSTGPAFSAGAIGGVVTDRITGDPALVRVEAVGADSTVHHTRTDDEGLFALRYLPEGRYTLRAYQDRNSNNEPDFQEPQGEQGILLPTAADTLVVGMSVLTPDTTVATLVRVEAMDSTGVRLAFDDFMDPEGSLGLVTVRLTREEGDVPGVLRVMYPWEFDALRTAEAEQRAREAQEAAAEAAAQAAADAAAAAGDSAAVAVPVQAPPPDRGPEAPDEGGPEEDPGPPLPSQEIFIVLGGPLVPRVAYEVVVTGVTNINGLPLGGGTASLVWDPPVDSLAMDSTAVDSLAMDSAAVADTLASDTVAADSVAPDTIVRDTIVPDTTQPDTIQPDTTVPDTSAVASLVRPASAPPPATFDPGWLFHGRRP